MITQQHSTYESYSPFFIIKLSKFYYIDASGNIHKTLIFCLSQFSYVFVVKMSAVGLSMGQLISFQTQKWTSLFSSLAPSLVTELSSILAKVILFTLNESHRVLSSVKTLPWRHFILQFFLWVQHKVWKAAESQFGPVQWSIILKVGQRNNLI